MARFVVATLLPLALAGCLAAPEATPTEPQATQAAGGALLDEARELTACPPGLPLLMDAQHPRTGGSGGEEFGLEAPCDLRIEFHLDQLVGILEVLVEGPEGPILEFRRTGVTTTGVNAVLPPESTQEIHEGPAPTGPYHYTWTASQVADFYLEIAGEESERSP